MKDEDKVNLLWDKLYLYVNVFTLKFKVNNLKNEISKDEMNEIINQLKNKTSVGLNNVTNGLLKIFKINVPNVISKLIIFNSITTRKHGEYRKWLFYLRCINLCVMCEYIDTVKYKENI